jgi:ribosomal-protein-alanine N-acetyltransferase
MFPASLSPPPAFATSRLVLRGVSDSDVDALFALRSNPAVNTYLERPKTPSREDVRAFVEMLRREALPYWVVLTRDGHAPIGTICLMNFSATDARAEIGFELHPDFQGKGLMREALAEVLRRAFANGLLIIEAWAHKENASSRRLLERQGFRRDQGAEAGHKGGLEPMVIYTLHVAAWSHEGAG